MTSRTRRRAPGGRGRDEVGLGGARGGVGIGDEVYAAVEEVAVEVGLEPCFGLFPARAFAAALGEQQ
ncbi:MAG: hypothetical protein FJ312_07730 [SAR202 cluster bacterium]|nr:hypothetical protein [SAR202 cluster bacterium]